MLHPEKPDIQSILSRRRPPSWRETQYLVNYIQGLQIIIELQAGIINRLQNSANHPNSSETDLNELIDDLYNNLEIQQNQILSQIVTTPEPTSHKIEYEKYPPRFSLIPDTSPPFEFDIQKRQINTSDSKCRLSSQQRFALLYFCLHPNQICDYQNLKSFMRQGYPLKKIKDPLNTVRVQISQLNYRVNGLYPKSYPLIISNNRNEGYVFYGQAIPQET